MSRVGLLKMGNRAHLGWELSPREAEICSRGRIPKGAKSLSRCQGGDPKPTGSNKPTFNRGGADTKRILEFVITLLLVLSGLCKIARAEYDCSALAITWEVTTSQMKHIYCCNAGLAGNGENCQGTPPHDPDTNTWTSSKDGSSSVKPQHWKR